MGRQKGERVASSLGRALEMVEAVLNLVSSIVLFILLLYVTAEVTMRLMFNSPLAGHLEMSQLLIAASVFLGLAYAQARRGHVGMDILINRLPPRPAMIFDTITLFLSFVAVGIIVWYAWSGAVNSFLIGDVTPTSDVPTWWSKAAVPIGGGLLCIRFLVQIGQNLDRLRRGELVHPTRHQYEGVEAAVPATRF